MALPLASFFPQPPSFPLWLVFLHGGGGGSDCHSAVFGLCLLVARSLEDDMQSSHIHSFFQPPLIAEVIVKWIQFRVSGHTGDPVVLKPLVCMVTGYSVSQMSDKDSAFWQSASHLLVMPQGTLGPRGGGRRVGRVELRCYFMCS